MSSASFDDAALLRAGALQRAILNSANVSSIATDAKGVIQVFNVGAERMLGYATADVVNQITPADISDPQEVITRAKVLSVEFSTPVTPGFEALVFKASRGIEDYYELTYIGKDGRRFPAVVSVTALRDAQDTIIGYLLIGTDNTARKHAEEAFRLAVIVDSTDDGIISRDLGGTITSWNRAAEWMFGFTASEMVGLSIRCLMADDLQNEEDHVLSRIVWTVKDLHAVERRRLQRSITALVSKNEGGSHALVKELRRILLAECVAPKVTHGE